MSPRHPELPTLAEARPRGGFLQVVLPRIEGTALRDGGVAFRVEITSDMPALESPARKALVTEHYDADAVRECERAIARCRDEGRAFAFEAPGFALRHASGGALVRVERCGDSRDLLFLRDIAPEGWNIANGASEDVGELADIESVLRREVAEEVLFRCGDDLLALGDDARHDELALAVELWRERLGTRSMKALPLRWEDGPDTLEVTMPDGRITTTDGLHVIASAADFSLECVRVAAVSVPDDAVPLDGEILDGRLLDRVVALCERPLRPTDVFRSGVPHADVEEQPPCPVTERLLTRI